MMTHQHNLAAHHGVTYMHDTLQQTHYWSQMAFNVTSTVHDCFNLSEKSAVFLQVSLKSKTIPGIGTIGICGY